MNDDRSTLGEIPELATDPRFDADLLRYYDFDGSLFREQALAVHEHRIDLATAVIKDALAPATEICEVCYDGRQDERAALDLGVQALAKGQVAALVLNGGLATRFGGVVKGTVNVFDDVSFLGAKIEDLRRATALFGQRIPMLIMNSFATKTDTARHLEAHGFFGLDPQDIESFEQSISIRLTELGDPFIGNDGKARYYAPGHGEFFQRLHANGLFQSLVSQGIKYLTFSNIDNLGATLDPLLLGLHLQSRRDMTIEVVKKTKNSNGQWDVGGAPVVINGYTQVVEGFRIPASVPPEHLLDFQTNNMYFSLEALADPPVLPRYMVSKKVEGRNSIAFEAVTCEASSVKRPTGTPWLSLNLVRVPRTGSRGRFFPVKAQEDLEMLRGTLRERLEAGFGLRQADIGG